MPRRRLPLVLLLCGNLCAALWAAAALASPPPAPWRSALDRIAAGRTALSSQIAGVLTALRPRLAAERPDLLARLDSTPPTPRATGFGLLPRIAPDEPPSKGEPSETRYALADLAAWLSREIARATDLAAALKGPAQDLPGLVDRYLLGAENFRRIDSHVAYHALWQEQGERQLVPRRSDVLELFRTWRRPASDGPAKAAAEVSRHQLELVMSSFSSAAGLRIAHAPDGHCVLPVRLATDIEDEAFLRAFKLAVEENWNEATAMREVDLRIEIGWTLRPLGELYPQGAPAPGMPIEVPTHVGRFGWSTRALTTGAVTTHVLSGTIVLGPEPVPGRVLAHEFSHLLGFGDEYARAFEGSATDPDGFVIIELIPFPESLLASPGRGRVTAVMVERLLAAYGIGTAG